MDVPADNQTTDPSGLVPRSLRFLQGAGAVDRLIFPDEPGLTSLHAQGSEALLRHRRSALHHLQLLSKPWLDTDERRDLFLNILEEVRKEHRFVVLGYIVMPEHFHLLVSEPQVGTRRLRCRASNSGLRRESSQDVGSAVHHHPPLAQNARSGAPGTQLSTIPG